jgi:hypothetical protein
MTQLAKAKIDNCIGLNVTENLGVLLSADACLSIDILVFIRKSEQSLSIGSFSVCWLLPRQQIHVEAVSECQMWQKNTDITVS